MIVVLARRLIPFPSRATEVAHPIVRFVSPQIPVSLGTLPRGTGIGKPWVLTRGMVRHEIENHPQAPPVCFFQEAIEVGHRPEDWIDAAIIGNVVAEVSHWRSVNG